MRRAPLIEWRNALRDADLSSKATLVGLVISTWANSNGECWPARSSIAAGASITVKAVDRALGELEQTGFLTVSRSKGGRPSATNRTSNGYALCFPTATPATPFTDANGDTSDTANGDKTDTVRERQRRQNGQKTGSPETHESVKRTRKSLSGAHAPSKRESVRAVTARAPIEIPEQLRYLNEVGT